MECKFQFVVRLEFEFVAPMGRQRPQAANGPL